MEVLPNNTFLAKTGLTDHDPDQDFGSSIRFMQKPKQDNIKLWKLRLSLFTVMLVNTSIQ